MIKISSTQSSEHAEILFIHLKKCCLLHFFFAKFGLQQKHFPITTRVSNSLELDQVGPDLGSNDIQMSTVWRSNFKCFFLYGPRREKP